MKNKPLFLFALAILLTAAAAASLTCPPWTVASLPEEGMNQKALRFPHLKGDGEIALLNLKTDESLKVRYRNPDGDYDYGTLQQINNILRCYWDEQVTMMDLELIELLDDIQDNFGAGELQVISGYRSPEYNKYLQSLGRNVAKLSLHTQGLATDIRISGVSTKQIRDYARSLRVGGVGYYPQDGFVHVDVGRVRYW